MSDSNPVITAVEHFGSGFVLVCGRIVSVGT